MIDIKKPYNELPHLPTKVNLKDSDLLVATLEVSDAISQLKTMLTMSRRTLYNTLDLLHPLFIPEAVSSSGVENIVTTNDGVYYAQIKEKRELTPAEKEALNYTEALMQGAVKIINKGFLGTNDIVELQKKIEPQKAGIRTLSGTQLSNPITKELYYTPPEGENHIRSLLKNFEDYFNEDSPIHEVFARMAILHYQFEAIHPFVDGNGRTGRMLMPLYLMKQTRLPMPILFISHYILEHRDEYYRRLREVTLEGKWNEWILYILKATAVQARYTCDILEKVRSSIDSTKRLIKENVPYLYTSELVDYLFSHAYFVQGDFQKNIGISPMTARKYLSDLEKINIVHKNKQNKKNRYIFITPTYINILRNA